MLGRVSAQNGSYQQLSIFMEVLSRIQNDYVDEPSLKNAVDGAIRGLVENVDPYGGYLTRSEERRVGEEWRSRWSPYHLKKKKEKKKDRKCVTIQDAKEIITVVIRKILDLI